MQILLAVTVTVTVTRDMEEDRDVDLSQDAKRAGGPKARATIGIGLVCTARAQEEPSRKELRGRR